jgi:predicted ATPase
VIDQLTITNFKAFAHADIRLGPYTLLSGLNSSGKSTVLQALALIRQANELRLLHDYDKYYEDGAPGGFPLNGELVELGTGRDVLHEDYTSEPGAAPEIGFRLSAGDRVWREWRARYGSEDDLLPLTYCSPTVAEESEYAAEWEEFTLLNAGFQYLRADRINPATAYPRSHEMAVRRGFLGTHGEFTIDYMRYRLDESVPNAALHHPDAATPRLLDQVEAWMGEICPGVRIQATEIEQTDLVRLGFQFTARGELTTALRRPANVGFGLTYVLPVVVACLTAQPGAMILLENPEAHVHPHGQSAIARLTCAAAAAGAQLVTETHSDHILNGVRLAVKRGLLPAADVVLHYFQRENHGIDIVSPAIGADGMLSHWPPGFFDEWDRSLDQLLD